MRKTVYLKNGQKIKVSKEDANLLITAVQSFKEGEQGCALYNTNYVLSDGAVKPNHNYLAFFLLPEIVAIY